MPIDLKIISDFFKGDIMYSMMNIITISSFGLTTYVFLKIKSINFIFKKEKQIANYKKHYEDKRTKLKQKNIPSDIFNQVKNLNNQLYFILGFWQKKNIKKRFSSLENDNNYEGLKVFVEDIIIILERDIL